MRIQNPLQMNDWEITRLLGVVLAIQFLLPVLIFLENRNVHIPFLLPAIGLLYLAFIPGMLLLRALDLHRLGSVETTVLSVGLSTVLVMFVGFVSNIIYPLLGFAHPISSVPLQFSLGITVLALAAYCYMKTRSYANPSYISLGDLRSSPVLFLTLLPLTAILGTFFLNVRENNILLLILILALAAVILMVGFRVFIPARYYGFAIFSCALALILHNSLISMHITGWDIHWEYYLASEVIEGGVWDYVRHANVSAMLSIMILAPVYTIITHVDLAWVFKIFYPFLFAFSALGIYRIAERQVSPRMAFLASFFFISIYIFFMEMLQLGRQQIAELFLILLVLVIISKEVGKIPRSLLMVCFSFALVTSHYGTSYLFLIALVLTWVILAISEIRPVRRMMGVLSRAIGGEQGRLGPNITFPRGSEKSITLNYVLVYFILLLVWYMYISGSSAIDSAIRIFSHFSTNLSQEFLEPEATQGMYIVLSETVSVLHSWGKYIQIVSQVFILLGLFVVLTRRLKIQLDNELYVLALMNFGLAVDGLIFPYFSSYLNTSRLFQLTSLFLAPFCAIGGLWFFGLFSRLVNRAPEEQYRDATKVFAVFLAVFLLFNTGFIYQVTNDIPTSISLSSSLDYPRYTLQEISAALWAIDTNRTIYADRYRSIIFKDYTEDPVVRNIPADLQNIRKDALIYLGKTNLVDNTVLIRTQEKAISTKNYFDITPVLANRSRVYQGGWTELYY